MPRLVRNDWLRAAGAGLLGIALTACSATAGVPSRSPLGAANTPEPSAPSAQVSPPGGASASAASSSAPATDPATSAPTESPAAPGNVAVLTLSKGMGAGDALGEGTLHGQVQAGSACFWLTSSTGWRSALVWPYGFAASSPPLELLGPDGQALARPGDAISVGGGGPPIGSGPRPELDPCGIGYVFMVAEVVSVNGDPVYIGQGSLRLVTRADGAAACAGESLPPLMLVSSDEVLRLRAPDGTDLDATWPAGFTARAWLRVKGTLETRTTIVDAAGRVVATIGKETTGLQGVITGSKVEVCGTADNP